MDAARTERWAVGALAVAVLAARAWAAASLDLVADEAYHWTWSLAPALGYYDQPPLVAWLLALGRAVGGDTALALRLPGLLLAGLGAAALAPHARDPGTFVRLFLGLPLLALLSTLAVPDAALLGAWALATAAALAGGRGWWAAGALAGLATLAKHDGALLLPGLIAAAPAAERRARDPWIGALAWAAVVAPHAAWLVGNDLVTLRFQLAENLAHPRPPGLLGPVRFLLEQAGAALVLPAAALPVAAVRGWRGGDRADRLLVGSSVPVLLAFLAAAPLAPPEVVWPAPAWVAGSVLVARLRGRWGDLAAVGSWLALFATLAVGAHAVRPLTRLPVDPGARFGEGRVLAEAVAREALPEGVGWREPGARAVADVFTERYQEAALIRWHTGVPARVYPGCGRRSQHDLDPPPAVGDALWFVRPLRSGPPACVPGFGGRGRVIREEDAAGRAVPPFEVFRLERLP